MSKIDSRELRQQIEIWRRHKAGSFRGAGNGFLAALDGVERIITRLEAKEGPGVPKVKPPARLEVIALNYPDDIKPPGRTITEAF